MVLRPSKGHHNDKHLLRAADPLGQFHQHSHRQRLLDLGPLRQTLVRIEEDTESNTVRTNENGPYGTGPYWKYKGNADFPRPIQTGAVVVYRRSGGPNGLQEHP